MNSYTPEQLIEALAVYGTKTAAAEALDIPRTTFRRWMSKAQADECTDGLDFEPVPSEDVPVDELWDRKRKDFSRKKEHADGQFLRTVKVKDDGPIAIWHFGDPHVDDDGCNVGELLHHADLVRDTDHVYGASAGDQTNNWVGRLAQLYGSQRTTQMDGWRLSEDFFQRVGKWLYIVSGNHDVWHGDNDPIHWILKSINAPYSKHGARIRLTFPRGEDIIINARHDFGGSSIWNPCHGLMKAAQKGWCDHIFIAGHRHISGYGTVRNPDQHTGIGGGRISHCIRVAGYKEIDDYAAKGGFPDHSYGPGAMTVLDPLATKEENLVQVFWDPEYGIDWLQHLRRRYAA